MRKVLWFPAIGFVTYNHTKNMEKMEYQLWKVMRMV